MLITHDHRDQCSPEDVEAIFKEGTEIVTIAAAAEKLAGKSAQIVSSGDPETKSVLNYLEGRYWK